MPLLVSLGSKTNSTANFTLEEEQQAKRLEPPYIHSSTEIFDQLSDKFNATTKRNPHLDSSITMNAGRRAGDDAFNANNQQQPHRLTSQKESSTVTASFSSSSSKLSSTADVNSDDKPKYMTQANKFHNFAHNMLIKKDETSALTVSTVAKAAGERYQSNSKSVSTAGKLMKVEQVSEPLVFASQPSTSSSCVSKIAVEKLSNHTHLPDSIKANSKNNVSSNDNNITVSIVSQTRNETKKDNDIMKSTNSMSRGNSSLVKSKNNSVLSSCSKSQLLPANDLNSLAACTSVDSVSFKPQKPKSPPLPQTPPRNDSFSNKIVIDVPGNNIYETISPNDIDAEHIYEEVGLSCNDNQSNSPTGSTGGFRDRSSSTSSSCNKKSMFDGASKDEILEYLEDAKERVEILINCDTDDVPTGDQVIIGVDVGPVNEEELVSVVEEEVVVVPSVAIAAQNLIENSIAISHHQRRNRTSNVSNSSSDSAMTTASSLDVDEDRCKLGVLGISSSLSQLVERNDSGVGTETSKPSKLRRSASAIVGEAERQCTDCEQSVEPMEEELTGLLFYPLTCGKCEKKRSERKEIISEFVDTEFKYGRDLRIVREEFLRPMEVAGLLSKDQLKSIFLNIDELIRVNSKFSERLQDAIDIATEQGDEVI